MLAQHARQAECEHLVADILIHGDDSFFELIQGVVLSLITGGIAVASMVDSSVSLDRFAPVASSMEEGDAIRLPFVSICITNLFSFSALVAVPATT